MATLLAKKSDFGTNSLIIQIRRVANYYLKNCHARRLLQNEIFISVRIEWASGLDYLSLMEYPWIPFSARVAIKIGWRFQVRS